MSCRLYIAAGGGGDLAAAMIVSALSDEDAVFATPVWERTIFDPMPGPRTVAELQNLRSVGDHLHQLTPSTRIRAGGYSPLPRLIEHQDATVYLVDASQGCLGITATLSQVCAYHCVNGVSIVDVGGDILARGTEAGLLSPTLDGLALAAALDCDPAAEVVVLGAGLDGELDESDLATLYRELSYSSAPLEPTLAAEWLPLFHWFPSEATGLTLMSAIGVRGVAEMRRGGLTVRLSNRTALVSRFAACDVLVCNELAQCFKMTASLEAAETILLSHGLVPEREQERRGLARRAAAGGGQTRLPSELEPLLIEYSHDARSRGIDMLTKRRIGEVLSLSRRQLDTFSDYVEQRHPEKAQWPVWFCDRDRRDSHGRHPLS